MPYAHSAKLPMGLAFIVKCSSISYMKSTRQVTSQNRSVLINPIGLMINFFPLPEILQFTDSSSSFLVLKLAVTTISQFLERVLVDYIDKNFEIYTKNLLLCSIRSRSRDQYLRVSSTTLPVKIGPSPLYHIFFLLIRIKCSVIKTFTRI